MIPVRKVAVTGAGGHIGNCLVSELIKQGYFVKVLARDNFNGQEQNIERVVGDLLEPQTLKQLCEGVDVIFHLAAQITVDNRNAERVYNTNVTGTKYLIEAAKNAGVQRFIHFSSIHAFQPDPKDEILDETRFLIETDKSVYPYSKAESERIVMDAVQKGLDAVILSPTAVIGPNDIKGSMLGQALIKIYKNKIPVLISGGYNWVDVRDVVSAAICSIKNGRTGEKYIISGNYCSLKELSAKIALISGNKSPKLIAPVFLAQLTAPFLQLFSFITQEDPLYTSQSLSILNNSPRQISFKKAQAELDYHPRDLEQTLRDTFAWYKQNNDLN